MAKKYVIKDGVCYHKQEEVGRIEEDGTIVVSPRVTNHFSKKAIIKRLERIRDGESVEPDVKVGSDDKVDKKPAEDRPTVVSGIAPPKPVGNARLGEKDPKVMEWYETYFPAEFKRKYGDYIEKMSNRAKRRKKK